MKNIPRCDFNKFTSNLDATPSTSSPGTPITAGATPHVKTAFTSLIDPTPGDAYGFWLYFFNTFLAATNSRALLDIAVSDTGVGAVAGDIIFPNYLVGARGSFGIGEKMSGIFVPLFIPAGKRISARFQSARASTVLEIVIFLSCCSPGGQPPPTWKRADAYGADTATSGGVALTPGSTGTESAWTALGGTTTRAYDAFLPGMQIGTATVITALMYHVEYGADSTAFMEYCNSTTSNETIFFWPPAPMYRGVTSGVQMQVRAECSGAAEGQDYAIYGLY
jgi:hypothetical protein